jgi:hypothetical protein
MSESRVIDRRGEERPPRPTVAVYPRCPTCKYFERFIASDGTPGATVCVYDPPKSIAQIRGEDEKGNVYWATWNGFPAVTERTRCGKHAAAGAN